MDVVTPDRIRRGDVFLVQLDPARGGEIRKRRPCVVVSPDDLNAHMRTVIVAPMTKGGHGYPFRVPCTFDGTDGFVVIDQLRAVNVERFTKRLGRVSPTTLHRSLEPAIRRALADTLGKLHRVTVTSEDSLDHPSRC